MQSLLNLMLLLLVASASGFAQKEVPRAAGEAHALSPTGNERAKVPGISPVTPRFVTSGPKDRHIVALTFDACSTRRPSGYDPRITETLLRTRTPATIFLGGRWMEDHPAQTRELSTVPFFELGNHTYDHPHPTAIATGQLRRELSRTQQIMYRLTGRQARYFRPPYGEYDSTVLRTAASLGMTTIEYDLPSGDPDSALSAKRIVTYVVQTAHNGSIIVMHINGRGWRTAETLPEIIDGLRRRHFCFVTISGLLRGEGQNGK